VIAFETARDIAFAYREVEAGEALLVQMQEAKDRRSAPDIRDAFGRRQDGLQLGIPQGDSGHRMYGVSWDLAVPIVEAHIAASKAKIKALSLKALVEMGISGSDA